jgi:polysaccharide biosynthesis/export protein
MRYLNFTPLRSIEARRVSVSGMKLMGSLWASVLAMGLIVCSGPGRGAEQTPSAAAIAASTPTDEGYKLRPGDVLQVSVWKETDLQSEVLIRPDGGLSFALAGELQAAGHTVGELTAMLEARIRKFIPDAVVTVAVKAAGGNRVYVIGKVNRPGDFPLIGPIDVMQALTLAGGATPFADTNGIRILRRDSGRQTSISFRYGDIARGRKLDQNILLRNGDTVVVP